MFIIDLDSSCRNLPEDGIVCSGRQNPNGNCLLRKSPYILSPMKHNLYSHELHFNSILSLIPLKWSLSFTFSPSNRPFQVRTREEASFRCNGFVLLTLLIPPWVLRLATVVAGVRGLYYRMDARLPKE